MTESTPLCSGEADSLIQQRISRFAQAHPDCLAIHTPSEALSFTDLERQSNAIAAGLIAQANQIGECIALLCAPSAAEALGLLGILKTGAIVVPINANHPRERLRWILNDSQAKILVYDNKYQDLATSLDDGQIRCVALQALVQGDESPIPLPIPAAGAAAMLRYSSGSTGTPKGILHTHRSTLELGQAACSRYVRTGEKVLVCGSSLAFNRTILQGACSSPWLVLEQDIHSLASWLESSQPTVMLSGPSTLRLLVQTLGSALATSNLRRVVLTGEALYRHDLSIFRSSLPADCLIINELGSNETKTYAQYVIDAKTVVSDEIVPVGRPLPGKHVRVLDDHGRDCAPGEVGDIVVNMQALYPGYWRQEELNSAAFLPATESSDWRIYRTGDRGRWNKEGLLIHCGRQDWQCKIRGQKVELMEVEAALCNLNGVEEAAVIHCERQGSSDLIAYYRPTSGQSCSGLQLRQQLLVTLPAFMVPNHWEQIDLMPRTTTGKIDRLRLPPVQRSSTTSDRRIQDPSTDDPDRHALNTHNFDHHRQPTVGASTQLERQLKSLWVEVLGHSNFGITDHFFMIGGQSLSAARLAAAIATNLGQTIPVTAIFHAPSILEQVAWLTAHGEPPGADASSSKPALSSRTPPNLVSLQPLGHRAPLFVVHGWGGTLGAYIHLARALAPDRPVLGLQATAAGEADPDLPGVRAMAAAYAEQILQYQPQGPIHLLGYSAGGWYAHAVAMELQERGAFLGLFGVLDSGMDARIHRRLGLHLLLQHRLPRLNARRSKQRPSTASPPSEPRLLPLLREINRLLYRYLHLYVARPGRQPRSDPFVAMLKRDFRPVQLNIVADIFTPADKLPEMRRLWGFYAQGGVRCHPLFDSHVDFHRPELMPSLAAEIEAALRHIESTLAGKSDSAQATEPSGPS